ncbi:MAG: VTT domain-containing protein [Corynebacterium sp.]|nr:VTT domain-containing protein [Corynebacterium sp.]
MDSREPQWWEAPGMPWTKKPSKKEIWCLSLFSVVALYGFAVMPLRAWLLGDPDRLPWLVALLGSYIGATGLGALKAVGENPPILWPLLLGALSLIKFDWLYWWAGKLWGRGMIDVWSSNSKRAKKRFDSAERWAKKLGWFGIFIAYVPIPLPIGLVVYVLAGARQMDLKKFLIIDYISAFIWRLGYVAFGYWIGEPAVDVLRAYGRIANYVAIALVIVVVFGAIRNSSKAAKKP